MGTVGPKNRQKNNVTIKERLGLGSQFYFFIRWNTRTLGQLATEVVIMKEIM
jgi:hypothetical protein